MNKKTNKILIFTFIISVLLMQSGFSFGQNYEAYKVYLKALLEQKSGKSAAAKKDYEKAISLDTSAIIIYKDLTYLDWSIGNKDNAMELAQKIDAIDGENPDTTLFLAGFYLMTQTTDSAKAFWDKTLKLDPKNETALSSLALFYFNDNKFTESKKYWQEFLNLDPLSAIGNYQFGVVQEKLNMNAAALESYDKVIKERPDVLDSYVAKANIYEKMGKIAQAVKVYEQFYENYPDNSFILVYLGRVYYLTGDLDKAQEFLLKAKKILKDDFNTAFWLGMTYERTKQIENAMKEFEFILTFPSQKDNVTVLSKLGFYYAVSGKYSEAEKYLLRALKIEPNNSDLLNLTALNYMDAKKYDQSIEYFLKTIEVKPDLNDAHFYLGVAYDRKGDWQNAKKALKQTLEMFPNDERTMNYLGLVLANKGEDLPYAQSLLEKALTIDKNNGIFIDTLGWIYFKLGNLEAAEQALVYAANGTRQPSAYYHLGDVYAAENKNANAWVAYCLAYDATGDKEVKKKLDAVQKTLSNIELSDRMLFRASSHYFKLLSLKTGYKAQAGLVFASKSMYFNFNFVKGEGIEISLPIALMPDAKIFIKDSKIIFYPDIVKDSVSPEILDILQTAAQILNGSFIDSFKTAYIETKGGDMIYHLGEDTLVLNIKDSTIKEIVKGGLTIQVLENKPFYISKIPSKIKIISKKFNYSVILTASPFTVSDRRIEIPKK
ncbi:MAG: tetratricopeptide repeat protein [Elusimicrobiota bacterium]|jgi:tetratricopeptide (TPR) repeat protein|nr:tetratricopeptide repeat protein [Elusimicrobiota bacterium]